MAKKKENKVALAPPPPTVLVDFRLINEDPNQPRVAFDEASISELAADIKQHGLIQPITVRVDPDSHIIGDSELSSKDMYHVVCGARRYRACVEAGIEQIPCIVREVTDEEAFELQISENLHRKNINPMEESAAFQALVDRGISTPEMIADKFGVSVKYVYDRLLMQKVIPEVQEAIRDGRLTITHGKQFARIPLEDQKQFWGLHANQIAEMDVKRLREHISDIFDNRLEDAVFDTTSKTLVKAAGACVGCQHHSGAQPVLWEDIKPEDVCFKPECWKSKEEAHLKKIIDGLKKQGKKVFLLGVNYGGSSSDLVLRRFIWDSEVTEEETDFVGVVYESNPHSDYKLGQTLFLEKDLTDDANDGDDNDSDNEEENDRETENNQREHKARQLNGDERLVLEISRSLVGTFKNFSNLFDSLNPLSALAEQCARTFYGYDLNETNDMVLETLGIERVLEEDGAGATDYYETMLAYALKIGNEQPHNLIQLYYLIDLIEVTERQGYSFDQGSYDLLNEKLKPIAIDIKAIAAELTEKFGHEYPDFSVPETAE